ncbi:hypothetical protein J6590_009861 [Homalodisca vitripennis]|nr:hypothetical protein J6590_009861 [Homalodisca vitripennis]
MFFAFDRWVMELKSNHDTNFIRTSGIASVPHLGTSATEIERIRSSPNILAFKPNWPVRTLLDLRIISQLVHTTHLIHFLSARLALLDPPRLLELLPSETTMTLNRQRHNSALSTRTHRPGRAERVESIDQCANGKCPYMSDLTLFLCVIVPKSPYYRGWEEGDTALKGEATIIKVNPPPPSSHHDSLLHISAPVIGFAPYLVLLAPRSAEPGFLTTGTFFASVPYSGTITALPPIHPTTRVGGKTKRQISVNFLVNLQRMLSVCEGGRHLMHSWASLHRAYCFHRKEVRWIPKAGHTIVPSKMVHVPNGCSMQYLNHTSMSSGDTATLCGIAIVDL